MSTSPVAVFFPPPRALTEAPVLPFWEQLPPANRQRLISVLTRLVSRKLEGQSRKKGEDERPDLGN